MRVLASTPVLGWGCNSSTLPAQRMVVWLGSLGSRALARVARSAGDQYAKPAAYLDEYDLANIPCVASVVLAMESPSSQFAGCCFHVFTCDACECGTGIRRQQWTFRNGRSSVFGICHLCVELQRFVFLRGWDMKPTAEVMSEMKTTPTEI